MVAARRGDVVLVNLDPTVGVEIKKTRPAIVLSNDAINQYSQLAVIVPLTKTQPASRRATRSSQKAPPASPLHPRS